MNNPFASLTRPAARPLVATMTFTLPAQMLNLVRKSARAMRVTPQELIRRVLETKFPVKAP